VTPASWCHPRPAPPATRTPPPARDRTRHPTPGPTARRPRPPRDPTAAPAPPRSHARQQRQDYVRLQARPLGRRHQRHRLLKGQRLGWPPAPLPLRRLDQRRDVPPHEIISLGVPDRPHQHVVRHLHRPRRDPHGKISQGLLDSSSGQLRQLDRAQLLAERLGDRVAVNGHGCRRQPVQPGLQPVIERVVHGVVSPRPDPVLGLLMELLELLPNLGLGPGHHPLADARP
jgi:hypothetical protein